jgi:ribonucleotide monophosphatase NagD (HAD superfamily)
MTSIPNENPLPRPSVPLIERFAPLAVDYDVLFCDVWGVVHNGVAAFADACDALARFRSSGGTAILLTNAPRPAAAVARILDRFGVPRAAYDAIVSSGDVTRGVVEQKLNESMFHIGPPRDLPIFDGLDVIFAPIESADYVVCSGLFDDTTETPESYRRLWGARRRGALLRQTVHADLRDGARKGRFVAWRNAAAAQPRACNRGFGAHRLIRRGGVRA